MNQVTQKIEVSRLSSKQRLKFYSTLANFKLKNVQIFAIAIQTPREFLCLRRMLSSDTLFQLTVSYFKDLKILGLLELLSASRTVVALYSSNWFVFVRNDSDNLKLRSYTYSPKNP